MQAWGTVAVGLAVLVGLAGVVVPVLPGLLLVWGAVAVWAVVEGSTAAWVLLTASTALAVASQVVKYAVPGRRLQRAGVPRSTLATGGLVAVLGFVLIPVIGVAIGFVGGVYLAERRRLGQHDAALGSTRQALRAVGLSVLIELTAALLVGAGWVAVVVTG